MTVMGLVRDLNRTKRRYVKFCAGNINLEEFVQIFVQIFESEDTGEKKTQ